jgi:carbonic anhydrase/SulP family sulfate permease
LVRQDILAGVAVFLVALPLGLGIALASSTTSHPVPLIAGLVACVVGGLVVGSLSGSHTSVSGPAAGLTVVVAAQIESLGSLELFFAAVILAGLAQILLGVARLGTIAAFCPNSVIQGLLAAIGIILVLKQTPHLLGHDADPEGDMAFQQPDHQNTFSEMLDTLRDLHPGAALIGGLSLAAILLWDRYKLIGKTGIPGPLVAVLIGLTGKQLLDGASPNWNIEPTHLVQVPIFRNIDEAISLFPGFSGTHFLLPAVLLSGLTIALVASLETLLNLEAVDKLDPKQRRSPPNRELVAQGVGNVLSGLLGGLPVTSVVVRGSVNVLAGASSRLSTIVHGLLMLIAVAAIPQVLNSIPLSCLAAVLLQTGLKLASVELFRKMWSRGLSQFLPFVSTVALIVFTDLLVGVLLGLVISLFFILYGNLHRPIHQIHERHPGNEILRIQLPEHCSFLNKAALLDVLVKIHPTQHVLVDARQSLYIDADILDIVEEFRHARTVRGQSPVSLLGFKDRYALEDRIEFIDFTTQELQNRVEPEAVLELLQQGNDRFRSGATLKRDLLRLQLETSRGQYPLAVILSCIDSRTPVELIFDLSLGDLFSVRIAGNIAKEKALGSMEYACVVAGAKLVVVLGHTRCGAVTAAANLHNIGQSALQSTGCDHLDVLVKEIQKSLPAVHRHFAPMTSPPSNEDFIDELARHHVMRTLGYIRSQSQSLARLEQEGKIAIVGGMYDVESGCVEFFGGLPPLHPINQVEAG